ncbi:MULTISPECIES: hypothetical protein [Chryseobacterium]|uniref:hypothetical protein n=1 Tax=Chryseobacterium TaxID=59732 RepID=UPI000A99D6B8|nr:MULTISPECIES: hypothetical protein [Chryseobacterium]MBF6643480.1 hypothetical protein [Chryseobacterium indologenes]MBU3047491.1 hypothetical protein [Chryseobacterium indologenes]MEB4761508.1 hypothetical protein [Chryseobacterium indologenes]QQQ72656.1 hypothetical protein JHW31_07990 [Chryseobacterium indologenes]
MTTKAKDWYTYVLKSLKWMLKEDVDFTINLFKIRKKILKDHHSIFQDSTVMLM